MGAASPSIKPVPSTRPGLGSIPFSGGVTFRVWAKFARSVSVAGDFNQWNENAHPLAPEGESGYWSVDVKGAKVGHHYKFFIPGAGLRVDPYASSVYQDKAAGVQSQQLEWKATVSSQNIPFNADTGFKMPARNEVIIYELHVGTFTTARDGSQGTLETAFDKLQSLGDQANGLGFNAIEIMPLGQYLTVTSSGYNPGYIFAVESLYGGPDAFRSFVNGLHVKGLAVILDVVYNHLADTDLWQFDGWSVAGVTCDWCGYGPVDGGAYFYEDKALGHTDYSHSRFDFGRPEVQQYLCDNVSKWLESRFVDGLRFDSVVNIRGIQHKGIYECDDLNGTALLRRMNEQVQSTQGWKLTIAEDLQGWDGITAPSAAAA